MTFLLAPKGKRVFYFCIESYTCPWYTFTLPDLSNCFFLVFQNACRNLTFTCPRKSGKCFCSTLMHFKLVHLFIWLVLHFDWLFFQRIGTSGQEVTKSLPARGMTSTRKMRNWGRRNPTMTIQTLMWVGKVKDVSLCARQKDVKAHIRFARRLHWKFWHLL